MTINIGVLIIGIVFLLAGVYMLVRQQIKKKNNTAAASAEVTGYEEQIRHDEDSDTCVYFPILRYYAAGQWYEHKADSGSGRQKYAVGERLEILYNPQNPDSFSIVGDKTPLILSAVCLVLGIVACVLAFFAG